MNKDLKVTVFSSLTCPWCLLLKKYLNEKKIDFIEKDITFNKKLAEQMFRQSGHMIVPQIWVGSEKIIGLDREKIKTLLNVDL